MLTQLFRMVRRSSGLAFWPFSGGRQSPVRLPLDGQSLFTTPSYRTTEEAAQQGAVFACVRLLAETIASLPAAVYRSEADQRHKLYEHPAGMLVERAPNPFQTGFLWTSQVIRHVCLRGNAFSIIERDPDGLPIALWPVPVSAVNVRSDGQRIWYEVTDNGQRVEYDPSDVLHFALVSDDGIRGMSILAAARRSVELGIEQETAGLHFYRSNATPKGIITVPMRLAPEVAKRMRDEWDAVYAGRRRTAILEDGWKYEPISIDFADAEWVQSRRTTGEDIARYFRIPPSMIGYTERSSYSSAESEWSAFLATTLGPWLRMIEAELTRKLLPDGEEFFHDTSGLIRADTASRYAAYTNALQAGWMTVNEVRRVEGLAPLDGGDQLRTPTWLQSQQQERAADDLS